MWAMYEADITNGLKWGIFLKRIRNPILAICAEWLPKKETKEFSVRH
jgi:hypothetical protein